MNRYALIIAGGSGTRLWPMSTKATPKQLIPFIDGRSLLQIAIDRLQGLIPTERIHVCAGAGHQQAILEQIKGLDETRFIAEPTGRDTLNAVGFGTGLIASHDPDAVVAVFTADHLIQPEETFRQCVERGYQLAEAHENTLVTFGIEPTYPATGYGYLQLGDPIDQTDARRVQNFKEKPDQRTAERYVSGQDGQYLWNSGMFVWQGRTLMQCIERFAPENYTGLAHCIEAYPGDRREPVLAQQYPALPRISVDYAVMEPASRDEQVRVAAVPMPVQWLDVGSWPTFAETRPKDEQHNALAAPNTLALDTSNTLIASSEDDHLIATLGVDNLIIIHTPQATLVCHRDKAEQIKQLHQQLDEKWV